MLGTRGARLGSSRRALRDAGAGDREAALEAAAAATRRTVEVMLPLIAYETELGAPCAAMVEAVEDAPVARSVHRRHDDRAAPRLPGRRARSPRNADFFSFGTNDLTQTALGLSRDDAERGFLPGYLERGIVDRSPFETIDVPGSASLVEDRGRARPRGKARARAAASAASTAATPTASRSSTRSASTTSAARRSGSRSHGSRRPEAAARAFHGRVSASGG